MRNVSPWSVVFVSEIYGLVLVLLLSALREQLTTDLLLSYMQAATNCFNNSNEDLFILFIFKLGYF